MKAPREQKQTVTGALTYRDVVEILCLVDASSGVTALEVQVAGLRLGVTRTAPQQGVQSAQAAAPAAAVPAAAARPETAAEPPADGNLVAVYAPILGTFYRAPAPGEPPYVQDGDIVAEDDIVGLIDVMKLFTPVAAGVAGRVVEIVARDAGLVECGQPLLLIEPLEGGCGA